MTIINKFLSFISIVLKQTVSSPFIQRQKSLLCQRIHSDQTELYYCHAHQLHCHQIRSKSERRKRNSRCACTYTYTYNAHKYTTHIHPLSALTHAFSFLPFFLSQLNIPPFILLPSPLFLPGHYQHHYLLPHHYIQFIPQSPLLVGLSSSYFRLA